MFLRNSGFKLTKAVGCAIKNDTSKRSKYTLVLVRHGESSWNKENKFTGWYVYEKVNSPHGIRTFVTELILKSN
jgi:hypothetical protein